MIGFMLATAFLSMSISNTATTLRLWPVVLAVVVELAHIAINLAGGAFEHPSQCAPLDDDPGDLRANDL